MIVIMVDILSRAFTGLKHWFSSGEVSPRRKRILDNNDNLGPSKRFKRSSHQPSNEMEPSENVPCDINPFSSRGHMLLSLTRKKDNKVAEPKSAPWKSSMKENCLEISSDEDDKDNKVAEPKSAPWKSSMKENCLEISSDEDDDVIIVSDKRNHPSLKPSTQYGEGSQLQNRTEDANIVQNIISTRPISNLPLHFSTPASSSSKAAMSRFCPPTGRRVLSSNTSSTMSKIRHSSASRIGRTSSASLNLISKTRTITAEVNMMDRFKYKALLESYIKTHATPRFPKPFLNFQEVEKTLVPSSRAIKSATSKPKVEILDLTKPEKQRRPVRLHVKSLHSKDSDDGSDVEIVSVTPVSKPIAPKVNSFENKIKDSKYLRPEWLENLCQNYHKILKDTNQESLNQQIKKDIYAKQNEKALAPIEERIKRYMAITETIILDETVEEEPKLPELTPNMLKKIQAALVPHPPSAVVAEGFGLRITRNDMHTLANVNWLNDEVINFYMNLLIERSKKENLPKVYAFNTFFYPKLIESGHASLRRWTRKVDIFAQDLIIVPVHLGVHWCMAIIDLRNKAVEYYDSMGSANNKCLKALLKYLEDESNDKKKTPYDTSDWKAVNMKEIPQQMNGSDCGMFACTFAEYKCRNAKITFSQKEMPYFRKKMVYEILTGKLMM